MAPTPAIKIQPAVEADGHAVLACRAQAFAPTANAIRLKLSLIQYFVLKP
jgi:hypothetical protein